MILAADQSPLFFNYSREKALHLLEMQRFQKKYSDLDLPNTGELTLGTSTTEPAKNHQDQRLKNQEDRKRGEAPLLNGPDYYSRKEDSLGSPVIIENFLEVMGRLVDH